MEQNNILKFVDGTEIEFAAGSTITDLIGVYDTFSEIDAVWSKMTEENLRGATFNGKAYENLAPYMVDIPGVTSGSIEVHFRLTSKGAIEILNEQIAELQQALADIAG